MPSLTINEFRNYCDECAMVISRHLEKLMLKMIKTEVHVKYSQDSIKDTVIVPADNGGRIVILNKDDYISKMKEKLKDTTIYTEVTDPTNNIQSVSSSFTQKLFQQYKITQGQ
ncbi:unnamed protein product [Rotaria sp. Silwood2]|nr:unnamed protein product [Rotaria sp. Silwood2]CAF4509389.1 unnamed protein product [Rotaria sp. Silwood2]CAF4654242.1 unnamed protein product [Rotaria sp. Silwood2]